MQDCLLLLQLLGLHGFSWDGHELEETEQDLLSTNNFQQNVDEFKEDKAINLLT